MSVSYPGTYECAEALSLDYQGKVETHAVEVKPLTRVPRHIVEEARKERGFSIAQDGQSHTLGDWTVSVTQSMFEVVMTDGNICSMPRFEVFLGLRPLEPIIDEGLLPGSCARKNAENRESQRIELYIEQLALGAKALQAAMDENLNQVIIAPTSLEAADAALKRLQPLLRDAIAAQKAEMVRKSKSMDMRRVGHTTDDECHQDPQAGV